jgi:hypothetical protein
MVSSNTYPAVYELVYGTEEGTEPPPGGDPIVPVRELTTQDVLYGNRITQYRWEVLAHVDGVDKLVGVLDGVSDGSLFWVQNAAVKGAGKLQVVDLELPKPGMMSVAELDLESVRLRPVMTVMAEEGDNTLPEIPWGTFLVSAASEQWDETGRLWMFELLDKCTVPAQDKTDETYSVAAGTSILQEVQAILESCGETIDIDDSSVVATRSGMVWEAGTSKLTIINELLDVAGYSALWMDGWGNFQATPRVLPADRSLTYELLGFPRELRDGARSIYRPAWSRNRDSFEVPNKVVAVQAANGDDEVALVGSWTNEDPDSPYSFQARGRWLTHTISDVECPDVSETEIVWFLEDRARAVLIQMSAVQAQVKATHLPIPIRVSDVLRFSHTQAGVDARHVVTRIDLDTSPLGLMRTTLQEVISL